MSAAFEDDGTTETLVSSHDHDEQDLNKDIKTAYKNKDAEQSQKLHEMKSRKKGQYAVVECDADEQNDEKDEHISLDVATEKHKGDAGDFIKSIIFGGLDGIITLFAIVASISGSSMRIETVLVLGFAKLFGDGLSMGVGDFLSEKAEIDFVTSEYKREQWELQNFEEGEIKEMIEIYERKGIDKADAVTILETMAKYPKVFLNHMMAEELELDASIMEDNPLKNGAVTFVSFLIFGTVPLLSYLIFYAIDIPDGSTDWKLIIAFILTCVTLFGMGAMKGHYCNANVWKSGFFVMANGCLAAGAAYVISWGLSEALDVESLHR